MTDIEIIGVPQSNFVRATIGLSSTAAACNMLINWDFAISSRLQDHGAMAWSKRFDVMVTIRAAAQVFRDRCSGTPHLCNETPNWLP